MLFSINEINNTDLLDTKFFLKIETSRQNTEGIFFSVYNFSRTGETRQNNTEIFWQKHTTSKFKCTKLKYWKTLYKYQNTQFISLKCNFFNLTSRIFSVIFSALRVDGQTCQPVQFCPISYDFSMKIQKLLFFSIKYSFLKI